jgi:hypothetical protein
MRSIRASSSPSVAANAAPLVVLGLLLAWHVREYWALIDDAYISFRYARNLAEGAGLVFNPGSERVEGYSNFLWVILLAAFAKLGLTPDRVAAWASLFFTFCLWLGAAWCGRRLLDPHRRSWWCIAPLLLAVNRSFAVWSTSGLETRLFELLALIGIGLLWWDTRKRIAGATQRSWRGPFVLGLAAITRDDAVVLVAGAAVATEWRVWRAGRWNVRDASRVWAGFFAPVLVHLIWRLAYYGDLLPNTYYAKFGGQSSGDLGLLYAAWFGVEYGLLFWVPFIVLGVRAWSRRAPGLAPTLASALFLHVAYVAYVGGDLFEFRFLDVLFVPLALLFQSGVAELVSARSRTRRIALGAVATGIAAASALLPLLSHIDYPPTYKNGFPGHRGRTQDDHDLVRLTRIPSPLRPIAGPWVAAENDLARRLTIRYVGLRQEEHTMFADAVGNEATKLLELIEAGLFPRDARIAISPAGVIPYRTRLWTIDRHGLCDAYVARKASSSGQMAHEKVADAAYLARRGVDIEPAHTFLFVADDASVREAPYKRPSCLDELCYASRLGPDRNLIVRFPAGEANARARFPRLEFQRLERLPQAR